MIGYPHLPLRYFSLNSSHVLRCHGPFCGCFRQFEDWAVVRDQDMATGRSAWHLANDLGRRDCVFLGHIQFTFAVACYGAGDEGKLERSHGDLDS